MPTIVHVNPLSVGVVAYIRYTLEQIGASLLDSFELPVHE